MADDLNSLLTALYDTRQGGTGGPVHIVTDDLNVEDRHLDFCQRECEDPFWTWEVTMLSLKILAVLSPMTSAEREAALKAWWESNLN